MAPRQANLSLRPQPLKAIPTHRYKRSVRDALLDRQWTKDITDAPTAAVLFKYVHLWDTLETFHLSSATPDKFIWRWSSCGNYTASSTYKAFFIGATSLPGAKLIWRAAVPPRVKFFFWLALHDRL